MCGIVGYVGPSVDGKALDVVMEGLARLEYRGYDSAGVALVDRDGVVSEKRAGKLANLRRGHRPSEPLPAATTGHRPHALGHPRRPHRRQRPPAPRRRRRPAGPDPQRHHRELPRAEERAASAEGAVFRSETDTEVVAHLVAAAYKDCGDLTDRHAAGREPPRGRLHAAGRPRGRARASSSAPGATARWSSASATARTSSGPTSPPSSATPATRSSSARTRSSPSPPRARPSSTSTAARPRAGTTR